MVTGIANDRIFTQAKFFERDQDTANLVVNQRDLTVSVGDDFTKLLVGLLGNSAVRLARLNVLF